MDQKQNLCSKPEEDHKTTDRWLLLGRNLFVVMAVVLFTCSLLTESRFHYRAAGYFFGAAAYFLELLLLTDCFHRKPGRGELFMVCCFAPMYVIMGISYLLE